MSEAQIAVFATAAVLVFWMLGAYNRLVALRNAIGAAWGPIDEVLRRRGEAIDALAAALREPLAAEHGALDALQAARQQVRQAADSLGARPVDAERAAALAAAEAVLAAAASRVLALLEQLADWRAQPALAEPAAVLRDSAPQLVFRRQLYNQAAMSYTDALGQFPTRLLAGVFSFRPAGRL